MRLPFTFIYTVRPTHSVQQSIPLNKIFCLIDYSSFETDNHIYLCLSK